MANPILALNDNFNYNFATAKSLMNFLTRKDRELVHKWLEKLQSIQAGSTDVLGNRNYYMWTLLLSIQDSRLVGPFTKPPPVGDLPLLQDVMPAQVYGDILRKTHARTGADEARRTDRRGAPSGVRRLVNPAEFLKSQPAPRDGAFCYMAAFSDWS